MAANMEAAVEPLRTFDDLLAFARCPPEWTSLIQDLNLRSNCVVKGKQLDCCSNQLDIIPRERLPQNECPKTLICHDMKGGYLEDRFVKGSLSGTGYTFYHWEIVDVFIYFSHHLITLPPLGWINAAHKCGVRVFGTIITENAEGVELTKELISSKKYANALVRIAELLKLDGWFLNIENDVENVDALVAFLKHLVKRMRQSMPESQVLWYDSVTSSGQLDWQNELNHKNNIFFDICDGIFLNYTWTPEHLDRTLQEAKSRHFDVFVGIDVFGRNCFGGGGYNCREAAEEIRKRDLSMAIFAPGWTYECLPDQGNMQTRFVLADNFWALLWDYVYIHPISGMFETNFHPGCGKKSYDLLKQEVHPCRPTFNANKLPNCSEELKGRLQCCDCLDLSFGRERISYIVKPSADAVVRLFCCGIKMTNCVTILVSDKSKGAAEGGLVLFFDSPNGCKSVLLQRGQPRSANKTWDQVLHPLTVIPRDLRVAMNNPIARNAEQFVSNVWHYVVRYPGWTLVEVCAYARQEALVIDGFGIFKIS